MRLPGISYLKHWEYLFPIKQINLEIEKIGIAPNKSKIKSLIR